MPSSTGVAPQTNAYLCPGRFWQTTLVSEWIADGKRPFAWLSLDKRDGDLSRFLTYLIAALQTHKPALGEKALAMLESPGATAVRIHPDHPA
ncbi:MAG: hypothetical protein IPF56_10915 [Chloroflexi bacterium]|nr:hypothetical protein [Chloroflexota bacterium]